MMYDAPPSQEEIDTALRLQNEYAQATPSIEEEAGLLVGRSYEDWQTALEPPAPALAPARTGVER